MAHENDGIWSRPPKDNARPNCSHKQYMSVSVEAGNTRSEPAPELCKTDSSITPKREATTSYQTYHSDEFTDDELEPQADEDITDLVAQIWAEPTAVQKALLKAFVKATKEPPITKASLSELDIGSIINNAKLRHDVSFDRDLSFRPNSDGFRGSQKKEISVLYWLAVETELSLVFSVLSNQKFGGELKANLIRRCCCRLPLLFDTIKDIIIALVPQSDHNGVEEHFDSAMLLQEVQRGVCDFVSIAEWVAHLLKKHCAPMRDEMVDRMVERIGGKTGKSIADGLEELFSVLESMKLDVANHQIRYLRHLLIEDTISFEKRYHESRIKRQRYDIVAAYNWFEDIRKRMLRTDPDVSLYPCADIKAFVKGLLQHLLPTDLSLPDTFTLDRDRVNIIRYEIEDIIREEICCDIFNEVAARNPIKKRQEQLNEFRSKFRVISKDCRSAGWRVYVDATACEIVRHVLLAQGSTAATDTKLESKVLTMLRPRWAALEHARRSSVLSFQEPCDLKHPDVERIQRFVKQAEEDFFAPVLAYVEVSLTKSPCDIVKDLVPELKTPKTPSSPYLGCESPLPKAETVDIKQDLVHRISHIAVLHWRIWEPLVYNNEDLARQVATAQAYGSHVRRPRPHVTREPQKVWLPSPTDSPYLTCVDTTGTSGTFG